MGRLTAAFLWLVLASPLAAEAVKLDAEVAYEQSQAAIGGLTGDQVLTDHRGQPLPLADLRGRPLVVSLVFTSCATVCPITTDHLRDQIMAARRAVGEDSFAVLTFGFDASGDTPAQLTGFAGTHRLLGLEDWYVASADAATTESFLRELGFSYAASARGFDHVTQTTILDAEGRVYRQVYGETFPLPVLVQPLKELVLGTVTRSVDPGALWDRINFLCTVYNPLTGAYRFDYGIFFGIFFGGVSLILTGLVVLRLWLERRRAIRGAAMRPIRREVS
ncbi:MAG: SCO family protein [Rhodobacteraceae bacterium]|nr:SCO family protein [uncultured Defluviimonas sp.]MCC0068456.1 SCO family protein [Paracoccaceae bacterium]